MYVYWYYIILTLCLRIIENVHIYVIFLTVIEHFQSNSIHEYDVFDFSLVSFLSMTTLQNAVNPLCVFWNFSDNQSFVSDGWSSSGLSLGSFDENSRSVVCISTHLTSFAVLVDVSGATPPSEPLSILTYIGCGISIICLVLTIIFLLSFR